MKKVLFVTLENPFAFGGGAQATRAYLDSVIDVFSVDNITVFGWDYYKIPPMYENIHFERVKKNNSLLEFLRGVLSMDVTRLGRYVVDYLKIHKLLYDKCIINNGVLAGYIVPFLNKMGIKTYVIHHNQEVEFNLDTKSKLTFGGRITFFVKKNEELAYKYSDVNIFLTSQDMESMSQIYGDSRAVQTILGAYDYKLASRIHPHSVEKRYDIIISGSLEHIQNIEGIKKIVNRFLPIINELLPNNKILLVGKNPTDYINSLPSKYNNIYVVSNPRDIMQYVRSGRIYLCPTDCGGGLKLRVMDGLKNGLPVLVHKVSARGYDNFFDKGYFNIYEDDESFAIGLKNILNYLNSSNRLQHNCINSDYYDYFGYESGTMRFRQILK